MCYFIDIVKVKEVEWILINDLLMIILRWLRNVLFDWLDFRYILKVIKFEILGFFLNRSGVMNGWLLDVC